MRVLFHERLYEKRIEKGLTQAQLAELTKISRSTIAAYEQNYRKPSCENLMILSQALRTSIDYLIGNSDRRFVDTTDISNATYHKMTALIEADLNNKI